jgi:HSP20 family protein
VTSQRDPFANFERMRRQIDELFGDFWTRTGLKRGGFTPRVDVYYCGKPPRAVVTADLSGIEIGDVNLEIKGRKLVISGERKTRDPEGRVYQQIEIEQGPFQREVELGIEVAAGEAKATYEDGILKVELPLVEESGATQVRIGGAPSRRTDTPDRG